MTEPHNFKLIAPHGGVLVNRLLDGDMRDVMRERAQSMTRVPLSPMNVADIECVSTGVYSPLTGFMGQADYTSVVHDMHLTNGLPWTVPVTLAVEALAIESAPARPSLAEPDGRAGRRAAAGRADRQREIQLR